MSREVWDMGKLGWRVAASVAYTSVYMRSALRNTSGCSLARVLVDGGLQLLKELINVKEIILRSGVGKRERVLRLEQLRLSCGCDTTVARRVVGDATSRVSAAEDGSLDTL
jgi:hypothetical protein